MAKDASIGEVTRLINKFMELEILGANVSLEDVCNNAPHLVQQVGKEIKAIKRMDSLLNSETADSAPKTATSIASLGKRTGTTSAASQYLIQKFHAHGGCSEVYIAEDQKLGRTVAIKFLRPDVETNEIFRSRLQREAEITSRLDHPGIVSVLSTGSDENNQPFYTMRFVEGSSLADRILSLHQHENPQNSVEFRKLINHFIDVCQTVAFAHSRDVIHRDIKPANIVTGNFGETFLIDWGLARYVTTPSESATTDESTDFLHGEDTPTEELTQLGNIFGTPAFMSPEHARGEAAGKSSDVFSLGATLYAILSGSAPYSGGSLVRIVNDARQANFPDLNQSHDLIPKPLIAICKHAMAAEPVNRYETPLQLADDLEKYLADESVAVYQEGPGELFQRWVKKNRTLVSTILTTCLVSTLILSVATWLLLDANQTLSNREAEAIYLKEETKSALTNATKNLYAQNIALASSEIDKNNIVRAEEILESCPKDFRSWEWRLLRSLIDQQKPAFTISTGGEIVRSFDFSPDGSALAVAHPGGKIQLFNCLGDSEKSLKLIDEFGDKMKIQVVSFSPDGKRIAVGGSRPRENRMRGTIRVWDLETKKIVAQRWCHGNQVHCVAWSTDGSRVATGGSGGGIRVRDAATLVPSIRIRDAHSGGVFSVGFLAESNDRVITTGADSAIKEWSEKGALVHQQKAHQGGANCLVIQGELAFTAGNDKLVRQWNLTEPPVSEQFYIGNQDQVVSIDVSSGGRFVVAGGLDRTIRIWDVVSGLLRARIQHHSSHIRKVMFDPTGRYLVSSGDDGSVNFWLNSRILKTEPNGNAVEFSKVSSQLLVMSRDEFAIWDPADRKPLARDSSIHSRLTQIVTANQSELFVTLHRDGSVILRDWKTGSGPKRLMDNPTTAVQAAFNKDDSLLVVAHRDGTVNCWDLQTAKKIRTCTIRGSASGVGFSPNQERLVIGTYSGRLTILDAETLVKKLEIQAHPKHLLGLALHPDKATAATTGNDGMVKFWDLETGQQIDSFRFGASWLNCLAFTPDGKRLVTGSEHTILFWDTARKQEVLSMSVERCIHSIGFSHNGEFMAVAGEDSKVRIWPIGVAPN